MNLFSYSATHVGRIKDQNEDFYFANDEEGLYVTADGMGGHAAGEIASRMAIDITLRSVRPALPELHRLASVDSAESRKQVLSILEEAVHKADQAIYARAALEPEKRGMATTIDLLFVSEG